MVGNGSIQRLCRPQMAQQRDLGAANVIGREA
jgi:hypothetical protein